MKKPIIVAIIPARKGSKAIKNKNIISLKNKPLIAHSIILAKKCGFNKIKLKKPNILIETKLKNSTFKILFASLIICFLFIVFND